jgi:hypothetical protein
MLIMPKMLNGIKNSPKLHAAEMEIRCYVLLLTYKLPPINMSTSKL